MPVEVIKEAHVPEAKKGFKPMEYAHVVLKTAKMDEMVDWYVNVVGLQLVQRNSIQTFLTFDGSQDRLALIPMKGEIDERPKNAPGLHHICYEIESLRDLVDHYRHLKGEGIEPVFCINHGVATSAYYRDPDGNSVEFSCKNFEDREALNEWFATGLFDVNPAGVAIDMEDVGVRLDAGEDEKEIRTPHPDHETWFEDVLTGKIKMGADALK